MKTIALSAPSNASFARNPFAMPLLPLFCVTAFLPAILNLLSPGITATNFAAAWGPVVAGLWIALAIRPIRFSTIILGPALSAALWAINWFIMAGKCCSTMD